MANEGLLTRTELLAAASIGLSRQTISRLQQVSHQRQLSWHEWWLNPQVLPSESITELQRHQLAKFSNRFTPDSYVEWLTAQGITALTETESRYPVLLRECVDKPLVLFATGDIDWTDSVPVAVVGTRHPTTYGILATRQLVAEMASLITVVSGGMYGLDTVAHDQAITAGGRTVAILGKGLGCLSQREKGLQQRIVATGGSVMSEYPPWMQATQWTFPARNRLIAGCSWGTVVTEAAKESGTMITVERALEYGRLVWAVPGPITSVYSSGTHFLLQQGASIVCTAEDVITDLRPLLPERVLQNKLASPSSECGQETESAGQIIKFLARGPQTVESLIAQTAQPIELLTATLSMLELARKVQNHGDIWTLLA